MIMVGLKLIAPPSNLSSARALDEGLLPSVPEDHTLQEAAFASVSRALTTVTAIGMPPASPLHSPLISPRNSIDSTATESGRDSQRDSQLDCQAGGAPSRHSADATCTCTHPASAMYDAPWASRPRASTPLEAGLQGSCSRSTDELDPAVDPAVDPARGVTV